MNIFENATRKPYRWETPKGLLGVEDLWNLSLEQLDSTYRTHHNRVKSLNEESLLRVQTVTNTEEEEKIEIVKHIVRVKQEELKAREDAKARREKRKKILEALEEAQNNSLRSKTPQELEKMLEELE